MPQPVIVAGARTHIGKLLGSLAARPAPARGGIAIEAAPARAGIASDQVDAVLMGNVVQAGAGPNPARLAAARGGIPMSVPATTINKLCLSGLAAIAQAAWQITLGRSQVVVAGGMESMSKRPTCCATQATPSESRVARQRFTGGDNRTASARGVRPVHGRAFVVQLKTFRHPRNLGGWCRV
jgi:acetyl-CoA acetyltransferase